MPNSESLNNSEIIKVGDPVICRTYPDVAAALSFVPRDSTVVEMPFHMLKMRGYLAGETIDRFAADQNIDKELRSTIAIGKLEMGGRGVALLMYSEGKLTPIVKDEPIIGFHACGAKQAILQFIHGMYAMPGRFVFGMQAGKEFSLAFKLAYNIPSATIGNNDRETDWGAFLVNSKNMGNSLPQELATKIGNISIPNIGQDGADTSAFLLANQAGMLCHLPDSAINIAETLNAVNSSLLYFNDETDKRVVGKLIPMIEMAKTNNDFVHFKNELRKLYEEFYS